ncbi:hypothetical protein AHiyo1_13420 [Arthrobacter sp. Hiyo1]|nr:hypothetical protein AHiyo1_13420 [Arthrobacter sp. Hiyo1]
MTSRSALPPSSTSSIPNCHPASAHTRDFQWAGRSRRRLMPGSASNSSWSRLLVLATQLSRTRPESSTRSASGPYQVSRGDVACPERRAAIRFIAGVFMATSCHGASGPAQAGMTCATWGQGPVTARRLRGQAISLKFNENTS